MVFPESEYPGSVNARFLLAAESENMLNDLKVMDTPGMREYTLKDFDATIAYLKQKGDMAGALHLEQEKARFG